MCIEKKQREGHNIYNCIPPGILWIHRCFAAAAAAAAAEISGPCPEPPPFLPTLLSIKVIRISGGGSWSGPSFGALRPNMAALAQKKRKISKILVGALKVTIIFGFRRNLVRMCPSSWPRKALKLGDLLRIRSEILRKNEKRVSRVMHFPL